MTPFVESLLFRAAKRPRRIAFSEAHDGRVREAIIRLKESRVLHPIAVLAEEHAPIRGELERAGIETINTSADPRRPRTVADLLERRQNKGLTGAEAELLALKPLWFANDLLLHGEVDGSVSGAVATTAGVLKAALWLIGPAPSMKTISSSFYMSVRPFRTHGDEVLTYTDCAVIPEPSPEQLADIAIAAAEDRRRVVGDEPVVAFLSYATRGSAAGPSVERVRAAAALVLKRMPDLAVDGEMQADAALIESVGTRKAPGSLVAGRANILVFPSLDAGNIAYKLTERLAGAAAVGPIIQGLAKPCSDLSRGASPDDIMGVAAVTALQVGP